MINTVLLEGFLSKEKLQRALAEIIAIDESQYPEPDENIGRVCLVISSGGGDALAAIDFVKGIERDTDLTDIDIKIYEASSTAAFIVLALWDYHATLEMSKDAELGIHRGEIRLSPTQISPDNKVDDNLAVAFRRYDNALMEGIKKTRIYDTALMDRFYTTDWLRLSAEECLRLGIVDSLF